MTSTHKHNRKSILRSAAFVTAAFVFCVLLPLVSLADVLTNTPTITDVPAAEISSSGSASGGSVIIAPPGSGTSSGGISSGSASVSDSEIIIGDNPLIGGNDSGSGNAGNNGQTSAGSSSSSVGGAPGSSGSSSGSSSGIASAPEASSSDTTSGKAPAAGSSSNTAAPAATAEEKAAAEAAVKAAAEAAEAAAVSAAVSVSTGPSSLNTSSAAGSVYANSAVTRINLDFSLITPTHSKGALNVARASVRLKDGSWQDFEYKDNVHFAFYKMKESRVDSAGQTWYIAAVNARRFGDTYTDDGEMKTELWLNASDCIVRNTIDISTTSPKRIAIVKAALATLGRQYVYGGNGPDAYDCSGLVKYVCKEAGITVPRTSNQLLQLDGQITAAELRPGDLMVRAGHCGIYIGNGIFVHASDSSVGVVAEYLSVYNLSNKFTNYVNVVGD